MKDTPAQKQQGDGENTQPQQQGGSAEREHQQHQGGDSDTKKTGRPIFRDWASI
jgi:hypothetical protein